MQIDTNGIALGDYVKDKVSDFQGTATAIHQYLTGCARVSVQPRVQADGKYPDSVSFDVVQLVVLTSADGTHPDRTDGGGPRSDPHSRV